MRLRISLANFIAAFFFMLGFCMAGLLGALFFLIQEPWLDISIIKGDQVVKASILLDVEGKEWGRFQADKRKPIILKSLPKHVINAFIASEDHAFFTHPGISLKGIARSLYINLIKRSKAQGASTITQQLVRLLFFDHRKTFKRKLQEQFLALAVEAHYTKELILEAYLNNLYFGRGIYGIDAASQRFWSIPAQELTIDQAASLAAIIPSPARYCPLIDSEANKARRNTVLNSMHKQNFISAQELKHALEQPVHIKNSEQPSYAAHAHEAIRLFLEPLVGKNTLYTQGLIIQTTLDSTAQQNAYTTFIKHIQQLRPKLGTTVDGALLTLDTQTGGIRALVGGFEFKTSQFNRALHAQRQIGSSFKPIIYAAALDAGIDFDEVDIDEPITVDNWTPQNFNKKCDGPMTLAHGLAVSKNTIAVKTLLRVGIPKVIQYARAFHIAAPIPPYPSLALGCIDTTPIEVAGMFNVFANQGIYTTPHLVTWVKDAWGKKIWRHKPITERVLSWSTTSKVTEALSIAFIRHKKRNPHIWPLPVEVCCKTGTTNECRTCWFAGATPSLTTVVYIGHDSNQSLGKDVYPSATAFPLWLEFNKQIQHPITNFKHDPTALPVFIHPLTGARYPADQTPPSDAICIRKSLSS